MPLLQLELVEIDRSRADVLERARRAGVLPEEIAGIENPAAVRRARNGLGDLAAFHRDADSGRALRDRPRGLARLKRDVPAAHARVVQDLRIARHVPRPWLEIVRLIRIEDEGDVVEWRRTDIRCFVRLRVVAVIGVGRSPGIAAVGWAD